MEKLGFWARRSKKVDAVAAAAAYASSSSSSHISSSSDLFGQTLRTVAILVGACVLFVGALSTAAVAITSKAMGSPKAEIQETTPAGGAAATGKKPLSI